MVKKLVFFLSLVVVVTSCQEAVDSEKKEKHKTDEIDYAQTLKIFKERNCTRVHITNPENNAVKKYILSDDPDITVPKDYIQIITPISKMIALSGTHIGMLEKLNGLHAIVGVSDRKHIDNPEILSRMDAGKIHDFIGEHLLNFEAIVQSKASLVIYSGFNKEFPHEKQLQNSGIVCLANYDWKENHPLGRAEWIKLFGHLIGRESEANLYFKAIEQEYLALRSAAAKYTENPKVFSGNIIGDFWYAPAGESYYAELFRDANSKYINDKTKGIGSVELSLEKVLKDCRSYDFWINPGHPSLDLVRKSNSKSIYFDAFTNGNMYCYSPNMNLYWEKSAVEPQKILYDLICIFHPEFDEKKELNFYKKLK